MTPSDSDAREVLMTPATPEQNAKAEAILAELGGGVAVIPLSLAQRILAALEAAASDYERLKVYGATPVREIAAELRALVTK